jgi:endonuclease VIII
MPEGDTVFRAAARLHATLAGHELVRGELNVASASTTDLAGARMIEVVPRGKHLLMRLRHEGVAVTLHSHLRMDGAWFIRPASAPLGVPAHEVRAVLATEDVQAIGHLLGMLDLLRTEDEPSLVGHLGPDLLAPTFDRTEATGRLLADPAREIADALRDQRLVAGLGNELVNEVCFLRGVNPWTPVRDVDVEPLLTLAVKVIRANSTRSTRSTTGDLRPGRTSYVFARTNKPCRRCGTRVTMKMQGIVPLERATWWCPSCQPA